MTNSRRLAKVRACLLQWIAHQQPAADSPSDANPTPESIGSVAPVPRETILIRDGYYCGRRFHTDQHRAVWFIEEDELKIYDHQDRLLCVLSGAEIDGQKCPEANERRILVMPQRGPETSIVDNASRRAA
jgi:hypothetical protein